MLSKAEIDRKFAARAANAENLLPARLQTEAGQAGGGMSPAEILRDIQERQNAGVITQAMPGPQAWGDYELPLPGTSQAQHDRAVKGDPVTPQHSAAEAGQAADEARGGEDAKRRRRERIQHEADPVDPYLHEAPEVAYADLPKAYDQAVNVPEGYPPMRPVHAEQFRQERVTPGQPMPVPREALAAGLITRPALADGHARVRAPEVR
jgi:hypothetical protein